jgi:hypothetical protein
LAPCGQFGSPDAPDRDHAIEAAALDEIGLKAEIEKLIADEARHKDEVEPRLAGWNQPAFDART